MQGTSLACEVATIAERAGDAELLARAALTYGLVLKLAMIDPVMVDLLESALAALPAGDSPLRARLLARLAAALQPSADIDEPVRLAREAIATARRLGDRRGLLDTMFDGLSAMMDVVEPRERYALNLEVESLARAEGDRDRLLRTHARLALDQLALGELALADARIDAFEALATELRASWILWRVPLFRAVRAGTEGRFADAEVLEARAREETGRVRDPLSERALIPAPPEGLLRMADRHDEMRAHDGLARRERAGDDPGAGLAEPGRGDAPHASRGRGAGALSPRARARPDAAAALQPVRDLVSVRAGSPGRVDGAGPGPLRAAGAARRPVRHARHVPDAVGGADRPPRRFAPPSVDTEPVRTRPSSASRTRSRAARRRTWPRARCWRGARYELGRTLWARAGAGDRPRARELLAGAHDLATERGMPEPGAPDRCAALRTWGEPAVTAAAEPRAPLTLTLALEGEFWTVTSPAGRTFRLKDSLGLQYLARLDAEPGREIHVLELVRWRGGTRRAGRRRR